MYACLPAPCHGGGNYFLRPLINNYILPGDFAGLAKMLTVMALVYLNGACCSYEYARIMVHISQQTVYGCAGTCLTRWNSSPELFRQPHPRRIDEPCHNDIDTVSEAVNNSFASLISMG